MEPTMRRRSILKFKKYIFMFFAVLLAVIFVSHYTQGKSSKKVVKVEKVDHKSHEEVKPTPRTESPQERRLRILRERLLSNDDDEDTEMTSSDVPYSLEQEEDDDLDSLSKIQRRMRKRKPPTRFFVMNSKCKMPEVDYSSIKPGAIPKPLKLIKCSSHGPIFALEFDQKLQRYRLQVDTIMLAELKPKLRRYRCNYREVSNKTASPWKSFQDEAVIEWIFSGIVAECHGAMTSLEDAFPLVQVPHRRVRAESDPLKRRPSVLLLGLDSVSRMNFKHSMPNTAEVVNQDGWFEMKGYNKVGDDTFSNLCAIFGGAKSDTACLQRFPVIWKAFKDAGYTTAFGADSVEFPVPQGFSTDYELRSLLEDIGKSMIHVERFGQKYCMGRRQSASYLYDFCMQFAQRLIEELDQPAFGVFWSSTVTSDFLNGPTSLDERLVEYLELMREHHVFERAIVILVSDQGQMSGDLVDLAYGYLEERLPMLHIYLPPWFREAYPTFASNLLNNRNRLTSPYDLHNTLRHILNLKASTPEEMAPLSNCRNSQSLLHLVPSPRSCEEACIRLHFCACNEFVVVPNSLETYHLAKLFVSNINFWMLQHRYNLFCQRLLLSALDYMERKLDKVDMVSSRRDIVVFRLRVQTEPEGRVLESTVRYNIQLAKLIDISYKDISSLSNRTRSDCVKDAIAQKFCVCYPKVKDVNMEYWANYTLSTPYRF